MRNDSVQREQEWEPLSLDISLFWLTIGSIAACYPNLVKDLALCHLYTWQGMKPVFASESLEFSTATFGDEINLYLIHIQSSILAVIRRSS